MSGTLVFFGLLAFHASIVQAGRPSECLPLEALTAASTGDVQGLKKMLQQDPSLVHMRYDDSPAADTLLHFAARTIQPEIVRLLLEHGSDVNAIRGTPQSATLPIHLVRDPATATALLANGANLVQISQNGVTPLQAAAQLVSQLSHPDRPWTYRSLEYPKRKSQRDLIKSKELDWANDIVRLLRDAGAEYDLVSASYLNDLNRIQQVVQDLEARKTPEACAVQCTPALRVAAREGREAICAFLLQHGADASDYQYPGDRKKRMPSTVPRGNLPIAAEAVMYPRIVQMLIERDANWNKLIMFRGGSSGIDLFSSTEATLLHYATARGTAATVDLLLQSGARIDARDYDGATALHVAASRGHLEIVKLLLSSGADLHARDNAGNTPLSCARQLHPKNSALLSVLGNNE